MASETAFLIKISKIVSYIAWLIERVVLHMEADRRALVLLYATFIGLTTKLCTMK